MYGLKNRSPAVDKDRVTLDADERATLERLVAVGKGAARRLTHARILLLADTAAGPERSDPDIVAALGTSVRTVERVRQRLVTEGLQAALNPRPQPARPAKIKIKGDVEQRLVQLACSDPPQGRCHWTLQLLADELVVLGLVDRVSVETVRQALKKNDIKPWIVASWCLPPDADAEFVWRMEDVIQTYMLPYDPSYPVVCFDEACQHLFGQVRTPRRQRGRLQVDYEYERKGVCHQLLMCEPLRGGRHVRVSQRRTRRDYALCVEELVEVHFPRAKEIKLVQGNRNTHDGASLYEAFPPAKALR